MALVVFHRLERCNRLGASTSRQRTIPARSTTAAVSPCPDLVVPTGAGPLDCLVLLPLSGTHPRSSVGVRQEGSLGGCVRHHVWICGGFIRAGRPNLDRRMGECDLDPVEEYFVGDVNDLPGCDETPRSVRAFKATIRVPPGLRMSIRLLLARLR